MTDTEPTIDLTKIDFPTDRLTIKGLRKAYPQGFDVEPPPDSTLDRLLKRPLRRQSLDNVLACTVDCERILADMAFKTARKQSVEDLDGSRDRETILETLGGDYIRLGLARGEHEAEQMLREIEAQATAQAGYTGGRPR